MTSTSGLLPGDLIMINDEDGGITEFSVISAVHGRVVWLARKTTVNLTAGALVRKYAPVLRVTAKSPGNWGNRIKLMVSPLEAGPAVNEFSLRVKLEPGANPTRPIEEEFYKRLSLATDSIYYAATLVNGLSNLIRIEVKPGKLLVDDGPLKFGSVWLQNGRDGLSEVKDSDFIGGPDDLRGLRLLEEVDEVAILCVPDAVFEAPFVLVKKTPPSDPCAATSTQRDEVSCSMTKPPNPRR